MSESVAEQRAERIKRLRIRCWRRGTKEMDLILGGYVDAEGDRLSDSDLDALEALIVEDDRELYRWVAGAEQPPSRHELMIERLRSARKLDNDR